MSSPSEPSLLETLYKLVDKQEVAIKTRDELISSLDKVIELQDLKLSHFVKVLAESHKLIELQDLKIIKSKGSKDTVTKMVLSNELLRTLNKKEDNGK